MRKGRLNRFGLVLITGLTLGAVMAGCNGSTGGGDDQDSGGGFVSGPDTVGTIDLSVTETNLGVGEVSGFRGSVRNVNGAPVENIRVSCDTEEGLALIEPTTGSEITDSNGDISGRIGCEDPGSLIVGCRVPVGGGLRKFVTVICEGDRPGGFTGFPGASGGGLGTGGVGDDGDPDGNTQSSVAVSNIEFRDVTGSSPDIDIYMTEDCDDNTAGAQPEPFGNTYIDFNVTNSSSSTVTMESYSYVVSTVTGGAIQSRSSEIEVTGSQFDIAPGSKGAFSALFLLADAVADGATATVDKDYIASGSQSTITPGAHSVTFEFNLRSADSSVGRNGLFSVTKTVAVDLDGFDHCD